MTDHLSTSVPHDEPQDARPVRACLWTCISAGILVGGLAFTIVLMVLGYLREDWPAHYLDDDQPGTWLTASALWLAGGAAILRSLRGRGADRRLWLIMGAALLLAAADDLHRWHERLDLWIHALADADPRNPITDRLDDLFVAMYGVVALWAMWNYRLQLQREPRTMRCFAAAGAFFAGMVVCDAGHLSQSLEDGLKVVAVLLILNGCLALLIPAYRPVRCPQRWSSRREIKPAGRTASARMESLKA